VYDLAARLLVVLWLSTLLGSFARAQVELPPPDENQSIVFGADRAYRWNQGAYEVWILEGHCYINQGLTTARSNEAALWVKRSGEFGSRQNEVITYLEGDVKIDYQRAGFPYQLTDGSWLGEFSSISPIEVNVPSPQPEPAVKPDVYRNALAKRDPYANRSIHRTQFAQPDALNAASDSPPLGVRRMRVFPRSAVPLSAQWFPSPDGQDWIGVIPTGVNLLIEGLPGIGAVDIAADRIVIWTKSTGQPDLSGQTLQQEGTPLEIYMEGNIVFRQGDREIKANRMYYDAVNQVGTILQTEVLTPAPGYRGLMRMRAEVVRQLGPDRFFAERAFVTSSRKLNPGYRMQASDVIFTDTQEPLKNAVTGDPILNPATGEQAVEHKQLVTSKNNLVFLGPVPVFYWPVMATDLSQPSYYLRRIQYKQDQIFGTSILTGFDMFQLLGRAQKPSGLDWTISPDYFSYRGPGLGSSLTYQRDRFLGIDAPVAGFIDGLFVHDTGLDRLGSDRYNIVPETQERYRVLARQRQYLPYNWRLSTELGKISDRNFLEAYFSYEWYVVKDQTTGLELKRLDENQSYSIAADVRVNDFFTQTNNLPRLDHFLIGQSFLRDRLTYYEHTTAAYQQLKVFTPPSDPTQAAKQLPLAWEVPSQGGNFITSHEVDLPFMVGPFKITPYVLGQFSHWGQDLAGNAQNRLFGTGGVRGSIPFWSANPNIDSTLLNVHGIAHKIVLEGDLSYSDSNQPVNSLPLYDPLQDDAQEYFERRFRFNTFGGVTPPQFDDRSFALRSGLGNWVTNPVPEINGQIAAARLGGYQRWQTKRGPPERRRIIDWIVLDTNATVFPDPSRDNFGQAVGLANYNFRWHIGDRLSLLSTGMYDFYSQGEHFTTIGLQLTRPPRGSLYAGFYSLQGPFAMNLLTTSYSYRMSPKWISSASVAFDVSGLGMVGNQVTLTRVGESFLTSLSFSYNKYLNNFAFGYMLEPRFLSRTRSGAIGGAQIPLAGAAGLE
jgi:hypothetical protein